MGLQNSCGGSQVLPLRKWGIGGGGTGLSYAEGGRGDTKGFGVVFTWAFEKCLPKGSVKSFTLS